MVRSIAKICRIACAAAAVAIFGASPGHGSDGVAGAYLAALQADIRGDFVQAAEYLDVALEADPENFALLQNAVASRVSMGDIHRARELSERLAAIIPTHQIAAIVRIADALSEADFAAANRFLQSAGPDMNPLLSGLLAGWIAVGEEDFEAAQQHFDAMTANIALAAYGQYHKALALALAGDFVSAEAILAGGPEGPLHLSRGALIAHAQILAQIDREDEAIALLDDALAGGVPDAPLIDLRDRLVAGEQIAFDYIANAADGVADAYLTLAEAMSAQQSDRIALLHTQLALHIRPELAEARLMSAEILSAAGQYALAEELLAGTSPDSPWAVTAEIRRSNAQRDSGDPEGGVATLTSLTENHPDRIDAYSAMGDALRVDERFAEAAEAYSRAIALIDEPQVAHWPLYYTRAICYERSGQWDAAEADFRMALQLSPEQPLVLNYLGYSLVEQRRDLDEALDMIERAVAGQPDDGYITDSLGWVLYRLGRYEEALPHMLRAVELTPEDAIINDHLGDVLWMVDRRREAEFQWRRALSLGPAADLDMDRVRSKLDRGLDSVLQTEQDG